MSKTSRQLPLSLRYPPDQRLDAFVAPPAGALAQLSTLAASGAEWLYFVGPHDAGKTHLALGFCAEVDALAKTATYLPLVAMAGRLREALPAPQPDMRIALDGIEHIAGKREDEVALFDFHNAARTVGAGVVYTAREVPDALGLVLPDLRSRLSQLTRIRLQPADDSTRAAILRLRAERRGLAMDDAAIDWLLKRVERDLGSLTVLFERLDRESLAAKRRVTVPFLREVLGS
ncbi:DnaA regulatory inactivator Hda [Solilutibacter tolerans]|uniref:Regulatory inactivation of DnaA Hda protein n=1 Tax=Solilutibacter tolerans TaxID=1604334 RepID=A0A1N6NKH5_9GAMM|nr:DnaA regulatory inactivator Hda [Lysobacter tolerans]SIP92543.1 regulatory inactivation of DnaA Hda protein [Lysobacter tolerans]